MIAKAQPLDVTDSVDLLDLAEEVKRSGVPRVLKRGDQELALLTPVASFQAPRGRKAESTSRDALLNIIGIGESAEPTDIARQELEYLAEAYTPKPR